MRFYVKTARLSIRILDGRPRLPVLQSLTGGPLLPTASESRPTVTGGFCQAGVVHN